MTHDEFLSRMGPLRDEAERLRADNQKLQELVEVWGEVAGRVITEAYESFGPFPVQSPDEAMSAISKGIFDLRSEVASLRTRLSAAEGERDAAVASRNQARQQASDNFDEGARHCARADAAEARASAADGDRAFWKMRASEFSASAALSQAEAASLRRSLEEARALIQRRHGMECPTYDDATKTCGGCEVSAFLATPSPEGKP